MSAPDPTSARQAAGDVPSGPLEKPGYDLEFHEEFDTPTLREERWLAAYLPHWSGRERARPRYSLPGKGLRLHIERDQPAWLPERAGSLRVSSLQTGHFSGPVGSALGQSRFHPDLRVREALAPQRLYTPRFGYVETRLRALPVPGYMVALWMIGVEEHPHESGEICICELFGHELTPTSTTVRSGVHPWGDGTLREEFHHDTFAFDASRAHVYAVDWRADRLDFFVDHRHLRTLHQSPQYPMQLMLSFYELPQELRPESARAPWPRTAEVDYVRGYRHSTRNA